MIIEGTRFFPNEEDMEPMITFFSNSKERREESEIYPMMHDWQT